MGHKTFSAHKQPQHAYKHTFSTVKSVHVSYTVAARDTFYHFTILYHVSHVSLSKYSRGFLDLDFPCIEILKMDNFKCFCAAFVKPGFPLIKWTQILQKQMHHQPYTSETANHYGYILITSQSKTKTNHIF